VEESGASVGEASWDACLEMSGRCLRGGAAVRVVPRAFADDIRFHRDGAGGTVQVVVEITSVKHASARKGGEGGNKKKQRKYLTYCKPSSPRRLSSKAA
jgi:hypothetical protein